MFVGEVGIGMVLGSEIKECCFGDLVELFFIDV